MAEVKLYKKNVPYVDKKDGKEKTATNFYLRCGSVSVPVEVKFFPNDSGQDPRYRERKTVMIAFAEELPETGNKKDPAKVAGSAEASHL